MFANTRARHERGSLVVVVMFFTAAILLVLLPMLGFLYHMQVVTLRRRAGEMAFYAAESGIARALSFIQAQPQGIHNSMFDVPKAGALYPFGNHANGQEVDVNRTDADLANVDDFASYKVKIYTDTLGGTKRYYVESTGRSTLAPQNLFRRVTVEILPTPFSQYSFFNTASLSAMDGRPRWLGAGEQFWGPVHSNRFLYVSGDASNPLIFHSDVTMVRGEVGGSNVVYEGLKDTNADYVELPGDLTGLKNAAASGGIQLPEDDPYYNPNEDSDPANDVPVPPPVFYGDPIHNYEFSFNNQTVAITNLFSGTSFTRSISPGSFNGAVVVNEGNVFVNGTVDGVVTIAATGTRVATPTSYNQASNGNVIVNGELKYAGHPADQQYVENPDLGNCDDVVGLIAERNFALDAGCPTETIVDAHIMVTGQASENPRVDQGEWASDGPNDTVSAAVGQDGAFFIEDGVQMDLSRIWSGGYDDSTGQDAGGWKVGDLYLTGGVVHFVRGQTRNSIGGYNRHYAFDTRLHSHPPPYYPLTGDTTIVTWRETRRAGGASFDF